MTFWHSSILQDECRLVAKEVVAPGHAEHTVDYLLNNTLTSGSTNVCAAIMTDRRMEPTAYRRDARWGARAVLTMGQAAAWQARTLMKVWARKVTRSCTSASARTSVGRSGATASPRRPSCSSSTCGAPTGQTARRLSRNRRGGSRQTEKKPAQDCAK